VKAPPRWAANLPAALEKQRKQFRKALEEAGLGHRAAEIEALARPAIDLTAKLAKTIDPKRVVSRIGGDPDLPSGAKWPVVKKVSLAFIAQIVLADMKELDLEGVLPKKGLLSLFAQIDPMKDDYGDVSVVRLATHERLVRTPAPDGAVRIANAGVFTAKTRLALPPSEGFASESLGLSGSESEAYHDVFVDSIPEGRHHVLAGWPTAMTMHDKASTRFLMQIDSDDRVSFEIGDYQTLRVYVRGKTIDADTIAKTAATMSEAEG
jgi:hypothetical protein